MSPANNHSTSQLKGTSLVEGVFKYICDHKRRCDGNAPPPVRIAAGLSIKERDVYAALHALENDDRITYGPQGIEVIGGKWIAPEAEHEPPQPLPVKVTDEYTPPPDLEAAQRDARHFWNASRLHLAVIEDLRGKLRQKLPPREEPEKELRRLRLENAILKDEREVMRESHARAVRNWQKFQGEAGLYKELYTYTQGSKKIAALEATIQQQAAELEWFQANVDAEVLFWKGKARYYADMARGKRPVRQAPPAPSADLFRLVQPPAPVVA